MKKTKTKTKMASMQSNTLFRLLPFVYLLFFASTGFAQTQSDNLPVREYTNPEEVVTFDRTTSFARAIDVINDFSQKHRNKAIIDRTDTQGDIGVSISTQHWMDALKLILRVKELQLVENPDFYEIVVPQQEGQSQRQQSAGGGADGPDGEGPVATTQTKEVRINAVFFEGNRRALQEIGVDWSTISENTPAEVTDAGQEGVQVPSSEFGDGPFVQVNSEGASNVSQRVFEAVLNFGEIGNTGISVQSLFSAFEAENLGEILASPTVKVMDGQPGRIQVGQDFSVKQRDFAGNVVEEFFSVGTILEVTPQIIEQNDTTFVHLDIVAERSSAQPDPVSTIINKQQAETQALLLDEQATVIAGLYRTEKSQVRRGIPILKDLPPWFFGLRYLFGYTSNDFLMRELVILLQVSIEPTIPERIEEGMITNKFRALHEQRQQNRRDVEESDKIMQGEDLSEALDLEASEEEVPGNPPNENADKQSTEDELTEKKDQPEPQPEEKEKTTNSENVDEPSAVQDPEIEVPKVQLNLGGSNQQDTEKSSADSVEDSKETQKSKPEPKSDVDKDKPTSSKFYIIGGSFRDTENARHFRDQLKNDGFNPVLLEKSNSNLTYVAYREFDDQKTARSALEDIKQHENSDAWLFSDK